MAKTTLKIPKGVRSMLVEVIEFLKKGPLTAAQLPHIRGMKHVIYALRIKGWPIATEVHQYYDQFGVQHDRAEYRLTGNWTEQSLPFGGIQRVSKAKRKPHLAAGDSTGSKQLSGRASQRKDPAPGESPSKALPNNETVLHRA